MWFDTERASPGWTWVDTAFIAAIAILAGLVAYLAMTLHD